MATRQLPDAELLRKLLRYDPETGKLYWRERTPDMFKPGNRGVAANCKTWNKKNAGKEAFAALDAYGYGTGTIFGVGYKAHRVAWKIMTGEEPHSIDHINGAKFDNRFSNLTASDPERNALNSRKRPDNNSGCTGVCWHPTKEKWRAFINRSGRQHSLGYHRSLDDAVRARKAAERKHGFSPNHGRKA